MSSPYATILTPIIDRAETLAEAIPTGLDQTEPDVELLVTCSGATAEVLEVAHRFARQDDRVRVLDLPPSPVLTGAARAEAVRQARSDRIFILPDDDLWLPDHVRTLGGLLDNADLATNVSVAATLSGGLVAWPCTFHAAPYRDLYRRGAPKVLYEAHYAFRRSLYERLDVAWERLAINSCSRHLLDLIIDNTADVRIASSSAATSLSLNSPPRRGMTIVDRAAEMRVWKSRLCHCSDLTGLLPAASYVPILALLLKVEPPAKGLPLADYLGPLGLRLPGSPEGGDAIVLPVDDRQIRELETLMVLSSGQPTGFDEALRLAVDLIEPYSSSRPRLGLIDSILVGALGIGPTAELFRSAAAVEEHPRRAAMAKLGLCHCLLEMSDYEAAVVAWSEAEALSPATAMSSPLVAVQTLVRTGRAAEAMVLVDGIAKNEGPTRKQMMALARALSRAGEPAAAAMVRKRAPRKDADATNVDT